MKPDHEAARILGVPAEQVRLLAALPAADPGAAQGFAPGGLAEACADLRAWHPEPLAGLRVYRSRRRPGAVQLAAAAVVAVHRGAPHHHHDLVAIEGDALVEVRLDADRAVLRLAAGEVVLLGLPDPLADLAGAEPEPAAVPAPPVEAWTEGLAVDRWLAEEVGRLARSAAALDRIAAAGLLSRLWAPGETPVARAARPTERARAWARGLDPAALDRAEREAVDEAARLHDRIDAVARLDDAAARAAVGALVVDRDDLQSVRRALRLAGRGDRLDAALAAVDADARSAASVLAGRLPALADDPDGLRWAAVAWQEPGAWWAGG